MEFHDKWAASTVLNPGNRTLSFINDTAIRNLVKEKGTRLIRMVLLCFASTSASSSRSPPSRAEPILFGELLVHVENIVSSVASTETDELQLYDCE